MLNIFKNIFSSNSIESISFSTLYKKIIQWRESKVYPYLFNLPKAISFTETFWKDVINIYKMTNSDNKEKAISVYWIDGEVFTTPVTKGNETSVTTNNKINVKYIPHPVKKEYYRKEIYLNDKVVKRTDVYYKNAPKKIELTYLFNIHTHPKEIDNTYSFFSHQDIKSLIYSNAVVTGLITDRLLLLIRTNETPDKYILDENSILTIEDLQEKMKLGVYIAEFNRKAIKQ